ncbi:hypothetical protein [Mesorhizobium sp. M1406]|uniref:hypothetical protein n=1 Tax=Mesorhizobium sp. M1406 TaxID=2957099 RepID=UPI00333BBE14
MFVLAPLIQLASWRWIPNPAISNIVMIVRGAAFLFGFVLLLTGRDQHSTVDDHFDERR